MINQKFDFKGLFGIFGVGALMILGVFFILNGTMDIWKIIEYASKLAGWNILVSIPLVIVSYIFGIINIELSSLLLSWIGKRVDNKQIIWILVKNNSAFLQSLYLESVQNQKILRGGAISFFFVGIGSILESRWRLIDTLGIVGGIGAFMLAAISILLAERLYKRIERIILQFENKDPVQ